MKAITPISIIIFVEHPERELEVARKIASKIVNECCNFSIHISSITFSARVIEMLRSDVIIFPSNWPVIEQLMKFFSKKRFISLNYEQVLSDFNKKTKKIDSHNMLNNLHHLSWSSEYCDFLSEQGVNRNNIFLTEKFIYELYSDNKRITPVSNIMRVYRNTYQTVIFMPLTDIQAFRSDAFLKRAFKEKELYDLAKSRRDFVHKTLTQLIRETALYCDNNPSTLIVLRPHPNVSKLDYSRLFSALNLTKPENLVLHSECHALDWVVLSDYVLSNYSSLLMDAKRLGVPGAIICSEEFPEYLKVDWMNQFQKFSSISECNICSFNTQDINSEKAQRHGITQAVRAIVNIANRPKVDTVRSNYTVKDLLIFGRFFLSSYVRTLFRILAPQVLHGGLLRDYFKREKYNASCDK